MEFAHLPGRVGAMLDPCGAVQTSVTVAAGESVEVTFLLGEGVDQDAARALVAAYHARGAVETALQTIIEPLEHAPVCRRGRDP